MRLEVAPTTIVMLVAFIFFAASTCSAQEIPQRTLITNVHVFDGMNKTRIENASVLIEGNIIKQVSTDSVASEGAYADLILVDGNPLENLDLVADPHTAFDLIMKDGVIYKNTLGQ